MQWLRRLRDLSRDVSAEQDLPALLPKIVDAAIELTRAERGFLVSVKGRSRAGKPKLRVEAARGFSQETVQGGMTKVSRTVVETVLSRGSGLVTSREEDRFVHDVTSVQRRNVLSILCVPLKLRDSVSGVLYLDHRFTPDAFSETDLPIVLAFAEQAAVAVETAELHHAVANQEAALSRSLREVQEIQLARDLSRNKGGQLPDPNTVQRFGALVGSSDAMTTLYASLERAARSVAPVLIQGETGTGKELVARELHERGLNSNEPFYGENCAALPEALLESELFGYVRGAFTGANEDRKGLFQLAGRGTLFLDEVADMSRAMQAKLLRVLQEGRIRRVGAEKTEAVHCRVFAASHRHLRDEVRAGRFREDLYYRLDVIRLSVPPLRERKEDLPGLLSVLLARAGRPTLVISDKALELLLKHDWPGNVRELENEAQRLVALGVAPVSPGHLSPEVRNEGPPSIQEATTGAKTLAQVEREMIRAALERTDGNKSKAARELGVAKTTLYRMLKRHGL